MFIISGSTCNILINLNESSICLKLTKEDIYYWFILSGEVKSSIKTNKSNYEKLIDLEELASQIYEITKIKTLS